MRRVSSGLIKECRVTPSVLKPFLNGGVSVVVDKHKKKIAVKIQNSQLFRA